MFFEVNLPSLSPTMEEGKIVKWVKKEKDPILSGEVLFEVETDKATMEYESPEDGYIAKILTREGDIAKVNELVAIISDNKNIEESELNKFINENNTHSVEVKNSPETKVTEVTTNNSSEKILITPLAKKIANLKAIYNGKLSQTDWYVVRAAEGGTAVPSDIATERSNLRTECATKEAEIDAKTTKAQVVDYQLPVL